jgi:hypothetical protein
LAVSVSEKISDKRQGMAQQLLAAAVEGNFNKQQLVGLLNRGLCLQ